MIAGITARSAVVAMVAFGAATAHALTQLVQVEQYTLPNGLKVVLAPDHTAGDVAVETWFPAGFACQPETEAGLAHLFEHIYGPSTRLMANPQNAAQFRGRTRDGNAQTRRDYTRYYALAPKGLLEFLIAQAADRLDSPDSIYTQRLVQANRDIVINEGHGWRNSLTGYGSIVWERLNAGAYGDHPYGLPVQRDDDLKRVTADDVLRWRRERYVPDRAILIASGDLDPARARSWINRYFSPIPPGAAGTRLEPTALVPDVPARAERLTAGFDAPQYIRRWIGPGAASEDADWLAIATEVLAGGARSAVVARAGAGEAIASTAAESERSGLASDFTARLVLRRNGDISAARGMLDAEVARLAAAGPTRRELADAVARLENRLLATLEQLGFQNSRNEVLGEGVFYEGDAEAYRARLDRYERATPADIAATVLRWMSGRGYSLELIPAPDVHAGGEPIDRGATLPSPAIATPLAPAVRERVLPNGLRVLASPRSTPLVRVTAVVLREGWASDEAHDAMFGQLGTACRARNRVDVAELLDRLGSSMTRSVQPDRAELSLAVRPAGAPAALALLRDLLADPVFDVESVGSAKHQLMTPSPSDALLMLRVTHDELEPEPGGASWDAENLTAEAMRAAAREDVTPQRVAIVVTGHDADGGPMLQAGREFASWSAPSFAPSRASSSRGAPGVYLLDRPGRPQSRILIGQVFVAKESRDDFLPELAAGALATRLNADLRTAKGWSYGAGPQVFGPPDVPVICVAAEVMRDHTADAVRLMIEDVADVHHSARLSEAGLTALKTRLAATIEISSGTLAELARVLSDAAVRGEGANGLQARLERIEAADSSDVARALQGVAPDRIVVIVEGDSVSLGPQLRAAGVLWRRIPSRP